MSKPTVQKSLARRMFALALLVFLVFFANVVVGGPLRRPPFLSDIQEMVTLFVAVGFFVFGTLAKEAQAVQPPAED